jgi:hypothetical protein
MKGETLGEKQIHNIALLRGEICVHKTSVTPPCFIEVPVPSQERE